MSDPKYRNAGWLREQYMDKGLSTTKIGSICGVAARTISTWLKRHDIPRRPPLGELSGPDHPQYIDGRSHIWDSVRNMPEYSEWRSSIFERDDWTCQNCGVRGGDLQADHIIPLSHLLRTSGVACVEDARNTPEVWDLSNGRTLCVGCHRSTDTFGAKALTFEEKI